MATVLKLAQQREAAAIMLDMRSVETKVDRFRRRAKALDDDDLYAWDKLDGEMVLLRAELDALVLDRLGVGLEQIREAVS